MLKTLALVLALVTPAVASSIDPVPYEALVSAEAEAAADRAALMEIQGDDVNHARQIVEMIRRR